MLTEKLRTIIKKKRFKYPAKSPKHIVIETDKAVYVDRKRIDYVIKDSVKAEPFGNYTIVTLSFVAKSFLKC